MGGEGSGMGHYGAGTTVSPSVRPSTYQRTCDHYYVIIFIYPLRDEKEAIVTRISTPHTAQDHHRSRRQRSPGAEKRHSGEKK